MAPLFGIIIVCCAVIGGFALENGRLAVLVHPTEAVIIGGSAIGVLIASNPLDLLRKTLWGVLSIFRRQTLNKAYYLSSLVMLRAVFEYARRNGATRLEDQLDHPEGSTLFRRHAAVTGDPAALNFICDTLRLTTMTRIDPFDLEELFEREIEAREKELSGPADTMAALADTLPGLGIVSAVLGVVITMNSLTESPAVIGQKVGMALVGTFLGIFLSYGFVGPLAAHLSRLHEAEANYYRVLRASVGAFGKGLPASIALEFGRRSIPPEFRPDFSEMEAEFRTTARAQEKLLAMP
jgi:chemotaxis protein MotA